MSSPELDETFQRQFGLIGAEPGTALGRAPSCPARGAPSDELDEVGGGFTALEGGELSPEQ